MSSNLEVLEDQDQDCSGTTPKNETVYSLNIFTCYVCNQGILGSLQDCSQCYRLHCDEHLIPVEGSLVCVSCAKDQEAAVQEEDSRDPLPGVMGVVTATSPWFSSGMTDFFSCFQGSEDIEASFAGENDGTSNPSVPSRSSGASSKFVPQAHLGSKHFASAQNQLHHLPSAPTCCVSRDGLLGAVHNLFKKNTPGNVDCLAPRTLTGEGGVGKSTAAILYAKQQVEKGTYDCARWLLMDSAESIRASWLQLARACNLNEAEKWGNDELAKRVYEAIRPYRYLLIFDNVQDSSYITSFLSTGGQAMQHILITSRDQNWDDKTTVSIPPFEELESMELIYSFVKNYNFSPVHINDAIQLHESTGGLPLAINLAMEHIRRHSKKRSHSGDSYSLSDYLKEFS